MDKVQIYYSGLLIASLILSFCLDGKPKDSSVHSFKVDILGLLFTLPIIGRIFLWW